MTCDKKDYRALGFPGRAVFRARVRGARTLAGLCGGVLGVGLAPFGGGVLLKFSLCSLKFEALRLSF